MLSPSSTNLPDATLLHRYKLVIIRAQVKNELQHLCLKSRSAAQAQAVDESGTAGVQARTRIKNQLQAMALSQGVQKKRKLWTTVGRLELEQLELLPYAAERRKRLLRALDEVEVEIAECRWAATSG
jgi:hypothetical protein